MGGQENIISSLGAKFNVQFPLGNFKLWWKGGTPETPTTIRIEVEFPSFPPPSFLPPPPHRPLVSTRESEQ